MAKYHGYIEPAPITDKENPFESMMSRFQIASQHLGLDDEIYNVLKTPARQVIVSLPITMDDGSIQVFDILPECLLIYIALQYWRNWANIREGHCVSNRRETQGGIRGKTNATRDISAAAERGRGAHSNDRTILDPRLQY